MAKAATKQNATHTAVRKSLSSLAARLGKSRYLRPGKLVLRLGGAAAGDYCLDCRGDGVTVVAGPVGTETPALVEVIGDAQTIRAIIDGEKDAVKQFYAGGIRIRGDLRYFSDVAVELGILKQPL